MGTTASICPRCGGPAWRLGDDPVCRARDCRHQTEPQGISEDHVRLMLRAAYGAGRTASNDADHHTRAQMVAEDILNSYQSRPNGEADYGTVMHHEWAQEARLRQRAEMRVQELECAIRRHREAGFAHHGCACDEALWGALKTGRTSSES